MKLTSLCAPIQQFARARACWRGDVTAYSVRTDFYVFCFPTFDINYRKTKATIKNTKMLSYGHDVFLPPCQKSRLFNSICSQHMCTANGLFSGGAIPLVLLILKTRKPVGFSRCLGKSVLFFYWNKIIGKLLQLPLQRCNIMIDWEPGCTSPINIY
jgi:hypothetical protein